MIEIKKIALSQGWIDKMTNAFCLLESLIEPLHNHKP